MFGIEFDKLLFVGILVGLIVGPARLNEWRRRLPQIVGRVHALYQQGRAQVTRDLDDLAPDWREYDPRQFHPRRILRELGADVRRDAESDGVRVGPGRDPGESPVEPRPGTVGEPSHRPSPGGPGDRAEVSVHSPRRGEVPSDLDHRRNDPHEGEDGAGVPRVRTTEGRIDEKEIPRDVRPARLGERDRVERDVEEPTETLPPPQDGRGGREGERRGEHGDPHDGRDGREGSTIPEQLGGGRHVSP